MVLMLVIASMLHGLIRIVISLFKKQPGAWIIGTGILFSILFLFFVVIVAFSGAINVNTENLSGRLLVLVVLLAIISIPLSMSIYQAWSFSKLNKDLSLQLIQVKELSEKTIQQELEKQHILESQKEVLEIKVEERTQQLTEEKKKSDDLLLNILPQEVAEELKEKLQIHLGIIKPTTKSSSGYNPEDFQIKAATEVSVSVVKAEKPVVQPPKETPAVRLDPTPTPAAPAKGNDECLVEEDFWDAVENMSKSGS
jgi:type III secretory pathway component EscR